MSTATRRRELHAASSHLVSPQTMLRGYNQRHAAIEPGFEFKPGFIYCAVRAISARINQNFDGWPSTELKKSYRTFIGKPCFVNHQNFDPAKARGKVIAARYIENAHDKYIETVMEIDAQRFPKLANEIKTGGMDSVSMGVEAGFTICSYCGNKALDTPDFCAHVKYHKGSVLPRLNVKTGAHEDVMVYEKCFKLGFFELSFVFDPADETAVVSRVIAAGRTAAEEAPPGNMVDPQFVVPEMPTGIMPQARRRRHAYGETQAPEDIDTLRDEDDDSDDGFKNYVKSPKELDTPDFSKAKRLDRAQEQEGLDADRRVEDVENIGGKVMPSRAARRRRRARRTSGTSVLMDPRTGRRYVAADQLPPELAEAIGAGGDPSMGGDPMDAGPGLPPGSSDEALIQEAEEDLQRAEEEAAHEDDDYESSDYDDDGSYDSEPTPGFDDEYGDDEYDPDDDGDDDSDPHGDWDGDYAGSDHGDYEGSDHGSDYEPMDKEGNYHRSSRNRRRATSTKGRPAMSFAKRARVAGSLQGRRHHAGDDGYTDGGPYHMDDNDEGRQEDVYISQVPSAEAVADPVPGDGTISNTENNLVARKLRARIQARNAEMRRDLIAYEQITGRRIRAAEGDNYDDHIIEPTQVDPSVSDPAGEELTGDDFTDTGKMDVETQPRDASVRAFRAFDNWLTQTTGRTARQHGNAQFLRRQAARFCQASGVAVESLFPTLGIVLREARRNEGTNRGASMRRRADESLEVAAPQDRIDVEAPVKDTTDALAQSSQFDLGDFGSNAGDNLADPDLATDSQIWAPGEGSTKSSNRKADGITAVRYAEAFIRAGLAPDTAEQKWQIAGLAQTMRHGTIVDRTQLLDAVNTVTAAKTRRTAGVQRGTHRGLPPGLGQRQLTSGMAHEAAAPNDDSLLFFK